MFLRPRVAAAFSAISLVVALCERASSAAAPISPETVALNFYSHKKSALQAQVQQRKRQRYTQDQINNNIVMTKEELLRPQEDPVIVLKFWCGKQWLKAVGLLTGPEYDFVQNSGFIQKKLRSYDYTFERFKVFGYRTTVKTITLQLEDVPQISLSQCQAKYTVKAELESESDQSWINQQESEWAFDFVNGKRVKTKWRWKKKKKSQAQQQTISFTVGEVIAEHIVHYFESGGAHFVPVNIRNIDVDNFLSQMAEKQLQGKKSESNADKKEHSAVSVISAVDIIGDDGIVYDDDNVELENIRLTLRILAVAKYFEYNERDTIVGSGSGVPGNGINIKTDTDDDKSTTLQSSDLFDKSRKPKLHDCEDSDTQYSDSVTASPSSTISSQNSISNAKANTVAKFNIREKKIHMNLQRAVVNDIMNRKLLVDEQDEKDLVFAGANSFGIHQAKKQELQKFTERHPEFRDILMQFQEPFTI